MANGTDAGRVVINRSPLWIPKLTPKDSLYDKFVTSFLKETQLTYERIVRGLRVKPEFSMI